MKYKSIKRLKLWKILDMNFKMGGIRIDHDIIIMQYETIMDADYLTNKCTSVAQEGIL